MGYLFAVTLLWAFSFSLIGVYLAGHVDAWFSVLIRVALATLVFLPFIKRLPPATAIKLMLIGAVQLGVMYSFYYHSFFFWFIFVTETFEWASTSCPKARSWFDIWNFSYGIFISDFSSLFLLRHIGFAVMSISVLYRYLSYLKRIPFTPDE